MLRQQLLSSPLSISTDNNTDRAPAFLNFSSPAVFPSRSLPFPSSLFHESSPSIYGELTTNQFPPLMATEDFAGRGGKKKRRSVCLPSCFRPSPTSDAEEAREGTTTSRWRRQLGGMQKKTVPVNAAADDAPPPAPSSMDAAPALEESSSKPPAKRSFLLHWFHKHKGTRTKGPMAPLPTDHKQHQPQLRSQPESHHPISRAHTTAPKARQSQLHQVMSKSRTRPEPASSYQIHDRARTATQTIHVGSHHPDSHHIFDSLAGPSVIAIVLTMLLICGRMGSVLFVCTWMYLLPRIKATSKIDGRKTGKKEDREVDMDSAEYKKMVVLEGLLRRDGRRPSLPKLAGAH